MEIMESCACLGKCICFSVIRSVVSPFMVRMGCMNLERVSERHSEREKRSVNTCVCVCCRHADVLLRSSGLDFSGFLTSPGAFAGL